MSIVSWWKLWVTGVGQLGVRVFRPTIWYMLICSACNTWISRTDGRLNDWSLPRPDRRVCLSVRLYVDSISSFVGVLSCEFCRTHGVFLWLLHFSFAFLHAISLVFYIYSSSWIEFTIFFFLVARCAPAKMCTSVLFLVVHFWVWSWRWKCCMSKLKLQLLLRLRTIVAVYGRRKPRRPEMPP